MQPDAFIFLGNLLASFCCPYSCKMPFFAILLDIHSYKRFMWHYILLLNSSKLFEILKAKIFKAQKTPHVSTFCSPLQFIVPTSNYMLKLNSNHTPPYCFFLFFISHCFMFMLQLLELFPLSFHGRYGNQQAIIISNSKRLKYLTRWRKC